jgi:rhodanese-related sulfurtransferase
MLAHGQTFIIIKPKNNNTMLSTLKQLFGFGPKVSYAELVKEGAIILDVRSKGEFAGGHIKGSLNIAVDQLSNNLDKLKDKNKAIITCCASGMRSASAKGILLAKGYTKVYNGGSWFSLQNKIK